MTMTEQFQFLSGLAPRFESRELEHASALLTQELKVRGGLLSLYGEKFHYETEFYRGMENRYSQFCEVFVQPKLYEIVKRPVAFRFVNSTAMNAFAYASEAPDEPFDFIGIHRGAVQTLYLHLARSLCYPTIFPGVGSPAKEIGIRPLSALRTDVLKVDEKLFLPACGIRDKFAMLLTVQVLDLYFFHEVTHLRNGHVEVYRQRKRARQLDKQLPKVLAPEEMVFYQTLEWDADSGAVAHSSRVAFLDRELARSATTRRADQLAAEAAMYASNRTLLRALAYSYYMAFRLSDASGWSTETQAASTYPLSNVRASYILNLLVQNIPFNLRGAVTRDEVAEEVYAAMADVERACGLMRGERPDPAGALDVLSKVEEVSDWNRTLKKEWAAIRPELERFSRTNRLPWDESPL